MHFFFFKLSYQKPRVDYFVQSMRADRKASGYTVEKTGIAEMGSNSYSYVKSQGGKVVRYSYRTVRKIRNSRKSVQRARFTAPYSASPPYSASKTTSPFSVNESTAPLVSFTNGSGSSNKAREMDGYGTLT